MNNTKLTFTISYDLTQANYNKIVSIKGDGAFVLVPRLNGVDIHTYYKSGATSISSLADCFTWGSSIAYTNFYGWQPEWTYTQPTAGTNTITYTTPSYGAYLTDTTDLSLSATISFGVYATSGGTSPTPTGDVLTTIAYSDVINASCTFTKQA